MVNSIDNSSKNLAENVETLRKKKKLTQAKLASLAEITRASVTLIESGEANPTLEILQKLARALQVSIDELISSPKADCKHIRAEDIPVDKRSRRGALLRKLLPEHLPATEMDEFQLQPGASLTGTPHVEGTREYFTCIEGQITIGVLGQAFRLKKGDVLTFPGDKPHSYKNLSKLKARGISVVFFQPN